MPFSGFQVVILVVTAILAATTAFVLSSFVSRRSAKRHLLTAETVLEPVVFLFEDDHLVDASLPARNLLQSLPEGDSDWARLTGYLALQFDGFVHKFASLKGVDRIEMVNVNDTVNLRLCAEDVGGMVRVTLVDRNAEGGGALVDGLSLRAMEAEIEHARAAFDSLPVMTWRENAAGEVVWANKAYISRCGAFAANGLGVTWPLPRLFEGIENGQTAQRVSLLDKGGERSWFDCRAVAMDKGCLCYAIPADDIARAEQSLRNFRQTLTKTFADLPIGLAVFNSKRQLHLFNPALAELTQLSTTFLISHPTLHAFLDRLRETQMMPEPKDYTTWRQHMLDLEKAAASGFHSETWMLPRGQTYRVTGRPHPGGAVAFLFEDISSEIAVTRRFRAELELGQNVLDRIGQAIAVFDDAGHLVLSNTPYDDLWAIESGAVLGTITWSDSVETWRKASGMHQFWFHAATYLHDRSVRNPLEEQVPLSDGRFLRCRMVPVPGGATLVSFALPFSGQVPVTAD